MRVEIVTLKDIPKEQINKYEDKVVYYTALKTKNYTRNKNAYPYLTGTLMRAETSLPVYGSNKEYSLNSGVDYAKYVWRMKNVRWTNKSTEPQWYYSVFRARGTTIVSEAVSTALKEL